MLHKENIKDIYSLSPMQEGMLFHWLMEKESGAYFEQAEIIIEGHVDIESMEKAYTKLVQRHDVSRTVFVYEKVKKARQVVLKKVTPLWSYKDYSAETNINEKVTNFKEADKTRGFVLNKELPMRIAFLKTAKNSYNLIWTFHHIIMDGWCLSILFNELLDLYNGEVENLKINLSPYVPYSNFISWYEKQNMEVAGEYWKNYLLGYDEACVIPDFGIKSENVSPGTYFLDISESLTTILERLAKDTNTTLNNVVQCAWGVVLQKYNRTNDAVFAYVSSGRSASVEGIEQMVGLCINTLPIRVKTKEGMTVKELLETVQFSLRNSEEYEYMSLAEIQNISGLGSALINHVYVFENYPVDESLKNDSLKQRYGFEVVDLLIEEQTNYDIGIVASKRDLLNVCITYKGKWCRKDAEIIGQHLLSVLNYFASDSQKHISDISLTSEVEKKNILEKFNNTEVAYPKDKTIVHLFEETVEKHSSNIALVFENTEITYSDLNKRVNQVAYTLRQYGVKPDVCVGLLLDRSIEMIIGILGILKAGGAYVPVDIEYPDERIDYMFTDACIDVVLTQESHTKRIRSFGIKNILLLDDQSLYNECDENPPRVNSSKDLSYVIYTSGTTGKPKGVLIEHKSVLNLVTHFKNNMHITDQDRYMQFATISFDASVEEIFATLLSGATLVLRSLSWLTYGEKFWGYIKSNQITVCDLPTKFFHNVITDSNIEIPSCVKTVIIGGEAVEKETIKRWFEIVGKRVRLINTYGPTETTVISTFLDIANPLCNYKSIGKPLTNTQILILDEKLNLVPVGMIGEIFIAGAGLARGYMNKPELTALKFVHNPFHSGEKMYRSGDLGRWLPDGNIEFLGRIDDQVKIRGYRIELSEIEAVLSRCKGVQTCIVLAKDGENGEKTLCAYIVCEDELDVKALREESSYSLPDYMIPVFFVQIEEIPLTVNGKVDKKALPEPSGLMLKGTEYVAPETLEELTLVKIWESVLGIQKVGVEDNFFEIGGNSIKAIQVMSRIHKELDVSLSVRDLFTHTTIHSLAVAVKNISFDLYKGLDPAPVAAYYPVSAAQKRMYVLKELEGKTSTVYNLPAFLWLDGVLETQKIEQVFLQLEERHESLRTNLHVIEGELVQKIHEPGRLKVGFEHTTESHLKQKKQSFVRPFDLEKDQLIRVQVLSFDENKHLLCVDLHHSIGDGLSMPILIKDFASLYRGEELPPLRLQYKDYAVWQHSSSYREKESQAKKYWLDLYADGVPILELPLDHERPVIRDVRGAVKEFVLEQDIAKQVQTYCKKHDYTPFMFYLAILTVLLSKYGRTEDVIIGVPVAGRSHHDLENIVGMFVNTLAIRNKVDSESSFADFLAIVRKRVIEAFDNDIYQFEDLVDALNVPRDLSRNPLFDVMFNWVDIDGTDVNAIDLGSLKGRGEEGISEGSKFDLTFTGSEHEGAVLFSIEYASALYNEDSVIRLWEYYYNIILYALDSFQGEHL